MADGRKEFFEHMRSAPFAAHQFVQAIHRRYDPRNDVDVHYAKVPDLRLRVVWENTKASMMNRISLGLFGKPAMRYFIARHT